MIASVPDLNPQRLDELLKLELHLHPKARATDLYKLVYQISYGPSHMYPSLELIKAEIIAELDDMDGVYEPFFQDLGPFVRISLDCLRLFSEDFEDSAAFLAERILNSFLEAGITGWNSKWHAAKALVESHVDISRAEHKQIDDSLYRDVMLHHSHTFRSCYHPHYRIIHRDFLQEVQDFLNFTETMEIR